MAEGSPLSLRYGCNPHQAPARAYVDSGPASMPLLVRNGTPGFINLLDALPGGQVFRDVRAATGLPAAASFKHVTPAGAAVGLPLHPRLLAACRVTDVDLSPVAAAYARARGADRLAAYGDFAAFSDPVDEAAASVLAREVSDGVIAPGYTPQALDRLRKKKSGTYLVLEIDPEFTPAAVERRQVFGITLEQPRNAAPVELGTIVSRRRSLPDGARRDLMVAAIAAKYTPSNAVTLALDGQTIAVAAGQQARLHCTRLACDKAEMWWMRQHDRALALTFAPGTARPARDNATEAFLRGRAHPALLSTPVPPTSAERSEWLARLRDVAMASDGFIPFDDNLERAAQSGVAFVWEPGGSARDSDIIAAANAHGMALCFSGTRTFLH